MSLFSSTYSVKIYNNFKAIEEHEYRTIVRYFEDYEDGIQLLDFDEYFEILVSYVNALFEIGSYHRHIKAVGRVIELSILHNVRYYEGLNIYESMLFKKASSHLNLLEYQEAEYILTELNKINPFDKYNVQLLKRCKVKKNQSIVKHTRAISVLVFLITAFVIAMELILFRSFFEEYIPLLTGIRNVFFLSGISILIGGELMNRFIVEWKVSRWLKDIRRSKEVHRH